MRHVLAATMGLLAFLISGCVTERVTPQGSPSSIPRQAPRQPDSTSHKDFPWGWSAFTAEKQPATWSWVAAVPSSVPRAELLRPTISRETLAALVPDLRQDGCALASAPPPSSALVVTRVQNLALKDCNQLHHAVETCLDAGKPVQVEFVSEAAAGSAPLNATVKPPALLPFLQGVAPGEPQMRVTEGGNPWVVLRQDGTRCKVMARVERTRGLLQVVLSLAVCSGPPVQMPVDVRAFCDNEPLACLTVAETLELLYGKRKQNEAGAAETTGSFASVSERADYLLPTNYKRLQEAQANAGRSTVPAVPALATVAGVAYPGPAILCDARALCAFLLQKQIYQAGEPERVSWLMLSGPALRKGGTLQLTLDLGKGPTSLTFALPQESGLGQ